LNNSQQSETDTSIPERTIALLGIDLNYEIPISIYKTVKGLLQKYNYKLLYFAGEAYRSPYYFDTLANILYDQITQKSVNGLILMSNLLSSYTSYQVFLERCLQFHPLPVVSLGTALASIPSVVANNFNGMYKAVSHLIEEHHLTRIAFLRGPQEHPDAIERFNAFTQAMEAHGLPIEESLLLQGNYKRASGVTAVQELFDIRKKKPGKDVQAFVCCNDYMAAGVLLELQLRGIIIPDEIALAGFDNILSCEFLTPTLTTVAQPFNTMAAKATEMLFSLLDGKPVPDVVCIDSCFIPRRSCGCPEITSDTTGPLIPEALEKLLKTAPQKFPEYLNRKILNSDTPTLMAWKQILSQFRQKSASDWQSDKENSSGDSSQTAWMLLGGTAYNTFYSTNYQVLIYNIGIALTSTLNLSELLKILRLQLPKAGIKRGCICLYENPENFKDVLPPWSRLILAFNEDGLEKILSPGIRFATITLLPEEIIQKFGRKSWVIKSLYFQTKQIGYALMDSEVEFINIYWHLRKQISGALNGALLLKDYQDRSRKLAEANETIQKFNTKLMTENLRIKTEMDVARNIQTALLPKNICNLHEDFEIAATMLPATEVGGDYYDVTLDKQGALWLGIGDVSGHGLKPGLIMMLAQTVHTTITTNYDVSPKQAIVMTNQVMIKSVRGRMKENRFMTCTLLKYQGNGLFQYAGMHLDLLVYRCKTETCDCIETNGIWLNVMEDITDCTVNQSFELERGDILVLYTDGITESTNKDNQMLDAEGLVELVIRYGKMEIEDMQKAILDDVLAWNDGSYLDDITLVVTRRIR